MDEARQPLEQATVIRVGETLDGGAAGDVLRDLAGRGSTDSRLVFDLTHVRTFDSAGIAGVLEGLRRAKARGVEVRLKGASEAMVKFLSLVSVQRLVADGAEKPARADWISALGARAVPLARTAREVFALGGAVLASVLNAPWRRRAVRLDRTAVEVDAVVLGSLPIVTLIGFLLGLILAMQAYVQLRVWGAEIYMADMVGVSVVTEIGPLMTAIVLAARSGSSNAAQLGAMVVSEEVDALRQMGVDPLRFLVVPKVIALALGALGLCLLFAIVAMAGGALFGVAMAGIELDAYREQTRQALAVGELFVAMGKTATFGLLIGIVSCALGLRVTGGSVGVARATTNAVVGSIFLIIVVDAAFVTLQRLVLA